MSDIDDHIDKFGNIEASLLEDGIIDELTYKKLMDVHIESESIIRHLQAEIEKIKESFKCITCGGRAEGAEGNCVIYCKHNPIEALNNPEMDNYFTK